MSANDTSPVPPSPRPTVRLVNFGFESLIPGSARSADWEEIIPLLASVEATGVSLAVGRPDWVAFPWPAHSDAESNRVKESGEDYVRQAMTALPDELELTLTIDALAPRMLEDDPRLAGVTTSGEASDSFASVAALDGGAVGERITEMAYFMAERYSPDRISLTELMFDDATFSRPDLDHFRAHTGESDWPRRRDGEIDTGSELIATWRSAALTRLIGRIATAVSDFAIPVDMDVRSPENDPASDRRLSGHHYGMLLDVADRLAVWNYPGLSRSDDAVGFSAEYTRYLVDKHPGRFILSTGLWARDEGELNARELSAALAAVTSAGATAVSVTPASMLTGTHWDALKSAWAP